MNPIQGQTDSKHQAKLASAIEQVLWSVPLAAAGGTVWLHVFTHFVGNGAELKIEMTDKSGKICGSFTEKIANNKFAAGIKIPPGAKEEFYANVKLPKHGLSMKSAPLLLAPPIEITNVKWDKKEARRGDILKLTADVKGVPDDIEAMIEIWEHDQDGLHDFVTKFPAVVKDKKIAAEWEFEYHEDTDEIPTEEQLQKYGNHYNPPEYFFRVKLGEVKAESGFLEFKDWIEVVVCSEDNKPLLNEDYLLTLPDGSQRRGKTDNDGCIMQRSVPPGVVKIEFPALQ